MAKLEADGSILVIYGDSCRHGVPTIRDSGITGYEFKTFENVEYLEDSLGKIVFVDSEGNDGEYWLDPVYEEALKIRETYCSNVFSAALALKASSPQMPSGTGMGAGTAIGPTPVPAKNLNGFAPQQRGPAMSAPPMMQPPGAQNQDARVETEKEKPKSRSINFNEDAFKEQEQEQAAPPTVEQKPKQKSKQKKQQPEQEQQDSGATDVLSLFFLYFFSTIFSFIWFAFMIPVRVTKWTFFTLLILGISNMLWLYFADNRLAVDMGAMIDRNYNID